MMEGSADTPPPLWPPTTVTRRHLRRTPSVFLNSDAFIIFLLIISLGFIFLVVIPPFHYVTCQFFRPHSVKKSWDFLSLVLVFFAIACGFLSRNKDENAVHEEVQRPLNGSEQDQMSNSSTPHQWHEFSDRTDRNLLHRPSKVAGNEHWRISGGHYITNYQFPSTETLQHCRNLPEFEEKLDIKRAFSVSEEEIYSPPLFRVSFPPLPPSQDFPPAMRPSTPPRMAERKAERRNEAIGQYNDCSIFEHPSVSAPPPVAFPAPEEGISRNKKKRSAGKEFSSSLKRKKKKKQKRKNVENFNDLLGPLHYYLTSYPPPPPMSPPSVFHHLTSTDHGKKKKECLVPQHPSLSEPITSPPAAAAAKTDIQDESFKFHGTTFSSRTHNVNRMGKKPPPPPSGPPSPTSELQIVMHGDYYGTKPEARSSNPDDRERSKNKKTSSSAKASPTENEIGDRKGPMFCPSPDVNSKADSFIERFRAGLKLERMNSIKERQRKRGSILGRQLNSGPQQ